MDKIEVILTDCLKDIKAGKSTLADCLNRYPSRREELEPLLKIALSIQEPPSYQLGDNYKQAVKAQLLQQIRTPKRKKSRSFSGIFNFGIPVQYAWARVVVSVLVAVVLISSLAGGTAYAAQSSLPGDMLYPVKTVTEDMRLLIAGGSSAKAELNLEFAQTRLEEMSKLANTDEGKTELAVKGYQGNLEAARQHIGRISDTSVLANLLNSALIDIQNQIVFCDNVIDAKPEYMEPVSQASTLSINEQIKLTEILARQNNLQAAQVNINTMQDRLQRAQEKANGKQYQIMQEVLLQYQQLNQLGEQILQNAQAANLHDSEIEALSLQAINGYLNSLDSIYQQVPPEYRSGIETCRQMTLQFQNQVRFRYQYQGDSGLGPQSQNTDNGNGSATNQSGQTTPQYQGSTNNPDSGTTNVSAPTTTTPSQDIGEGQGSGGTGSGNGTPPGTSTGGNSGSTSEQKP